ncbi:bile acid:sodium symporter [Hylemonella gracilis str. Niagara R]|uniref:Bile acid:sodium symporter n=1 Tax=Hylemonella gracilis str. Niagara R TaxID=1458275 RepID=A0A016XH96_9BURK|nr:bile acid:sodium symporter family protein [Hylemonella gracilis]EYC51285.1 bile acid:sodium symporter [Hylemonella gracilis str. Niagara R]
MSFIDLLPQLLLGALALVMFGLGLSLTVGDFARLRHHPRAVLLALMMQMVLLPAMAWLLVVLVGLAPVYAVGLLLLAASPGGVSANLFSHLFGGNVAMNISLTAINTLLSIVSLPLITNFAIAAFVQSGQIVPLQFGKVFEVVAVILLPVLFGMAVRRRSPAFAAHMERPMKALSMGVLAAFALIAIVKEWTALSQTLVSLGPVVLAFNLLSLFAGYYLSRGAGLDQPMATAVSFEIGIHNSTLAIFVALSVLGNFQLALPAAVYSVSMYLTAALFGLLVLRRR